MVFTFSSCTEESEPDTYVVYTGDDTLVVTGFDGDPYEEELPPELNDSNRIKINSKNHKKFLDKYGFYEINWDILSDAYIYSSYFEEHGAHGYQAKFGENPLFLSEKNIKIDGYVITFNKEEDDGTYSIKYMLSLYPNDGCFFCGGGGPETVMELNLKPGQREFRMDEYQKFRGRLVLNENDPFKLNYRLFEAEVLEDDI